MRQNIVDVGPPAGSFYRRCATRSRSRRSSPRCPHVETSSSRWWRCAINWPYSAGRIDASARLTVFSGCACAGGGPAGRTGSCWSTRPRLPVGIVKDSDGWGIARRRPGRPRIEPQLRRLIQRMAMENGLWGAPRIHGELLKLGFIVSERTVSRYLPDRRTRRSQTWRTFFANHVGNLAFTSTGPCRPVPLSCGPYGSTPWAVVDWPASHQPASLGRCFVQNHLCRRTRTRFTSGTDPPRSRAVETSAGRPPSRASFAEGASVRFKRGPHGDPASTSARVGSFRV